MNSLKSHIVVPLATLSLLAAGCSNLTPGENAAVFGGVAGAATGIALGASGVSSAITVPTAIGAGALAAGAAYFYAKYQATETQKRVAEQRARLYFAQQQKEAARQKAQQAKVAAKKAPTPRYVAVATPKDDRFKGQDAVMIFDTQTQRLASDQVYDMKETPKVGQTKKFDTYTAEYVGASGGTGI